MRLFLLFALSTIAAAQPRDCDLGRVVDNRPPIYPPIAKAAHVMGVVVMIATFEETGEVSGVRIVAGPVMLQSTAIEYVKGWRAIEYSGIRNCPVAVTYILDQPDAPSAGFRRIDSQHVQVFGQFPCLCDPAPVLGKRRRHFWLF
jgi:hypothetical protein